MADDTLLRPKRAMADDKGRTGIWKKKDENSMIVRFSYHDRIYFPDSYRYGRGFGWLLRWLR